MARKYGVRSAMPGFIGRRLCPQLVFVKPDFSKYVRVAGATRAIFVDFDPDFEAGSLDEAFLDITDYCRLHSTTGKHIPHGFAAGTAIQATIFKTCAHRWRHAHPFCGF